METTAFDQENLASWNRERSPEDRRDFISNRLASASLVEIELDV